MITITENVVSVTPTDAGIAVSVTEEPVSVAVINGVTTLSALTDVDVTGASENQVLSMGANGVARFAAQSEPGRVRVNADGDLGFLVDQIIAGENVTLTLNSNGQIVISGQASGGGAIPTAPTVSVAREGGTATLSITRSSDFQFWQIVERRIETSGAWSEISNTQFTLSDSLTDSISPGTTHYYRSKVASGVGFSDYSTIVSIFRDELPYYLLRLLGANITDERWSDSSGTSDRPVQRGACYEFDGVNDAIHVSASSGDITSVSSLDETGAVVALTATFVTDHYEISSPTAGKRWNIKAWAAGVTPTADQKAAKTLDDTGGQANLFAWFKADERAGSMSFDSSGLANHGTITNATLSSFHATQDGYSFSDQVGYSTGRYFNGSEFKNLGDLGLTSASIRIKFIHFADDDRRLFSHATGPSSASGLVGIDNGVLRLGGNYSWSTLATGLALNSYYDLLLNFSSGQVTGTLNGVALTTQTTTFDFDGNEFSIADDFTANGYGNNFLGIMFSFEINGTEYISGADASLRAPRDESSTTLNAVGDTLQYSDRVNYSADLVNAHCATLSGSQTFVVQHDAVFNFSANEPIEISCWFKTSSSSNQSILTKMSSADAFRGWDLQISNLGRIVFIAIETWPSAVLFVQTTQTFNDGGWHYLEMSYDGTAAAGVTIDVDGTTYSTVTNQDTLGSYAVSNSVGVRIGSRGDNSYYFDGSLCDIKFSKTGVLIERWMLAEGAGSYAYGIVGDHHAAISGATQATLWGTTQDNVHGNLRNGFSLYEHATLTPIKVPYGNDGNPLSITAPAGYALIGNRPSGDFLQNDVETLVNINPDYSAELISEGLANNALVGEGQTDPAGVEVTRDTGGNITEIAITED